MFRARVRNLSVVVAGKQAKRVSGLQARQVRHQRDATRKGGKAANNLKMQAGDRVRVSGRENDHRQSL